jgi:hypothetical protein
VQFARTISQDYACERREKLSRVHRMIRLLLPYFAVCHVHFFCGMRRCARVYRTGCILSGLWLKCFFLVYSGPQVDHQSLSVDPKVVG